MSSSPTQEDLEELERKRRVVGICCYNLLGLFSTIGFISAIYSYAYCDFIERYVTLTPDTDPSTVCDDIGYTSGSGLNDVCNALLEPHGIGFEGFWVTVPVNTQVCFSYTQPTPWGWVTPNFDTKFNSARALSITGTILGGAAWFTLMLASCCKLDQSKLKGMSCYFFLATLFQGLSLLVFRSNVCDAGFFIPYFIDPRNTGSDTSVTTPPDFVQSVTCKLSTGSKLAIVATVFWFVCNNMIPLSLVPEPLWAGGEQPVPGGPVNTNRGGGGQPEEAGTTGGTGVNAEEEA